MSPGRILSACAASVAVAGCALVAIGMSRAEGRSAANPATAPSVPTHTARPAYLPIRTTASTTAAPTPAAPPATATSSSPTHPANSTAPAHRRVPAVRRTSPAAAPTSRPAAVRPAPKQAAPRTPTKAAAKPTHRSVTTVKGRSLPLHYSTGSATRVITVVAHSTGSTTAVLQAWTKASGGGWLKYGSSVTAHVGADGLSTHPSESRSATPIGSYTLTHAFGHYSDPGTTLPYVHTSPADWWISQPGRLYNTRQHCSSGCAFTRGAPNEHLYYETPYYNYAVVIDYNTRNAPGGVRQGAGSAFFLHVTDGNPTAGCVAINQTKLVSLLRWLTPNAHPRILIGVA